MRERLAWLVLTAAAGAAHGQGEITYYWDVNDSGSNTGVIAPGESVNLKLRADWSPTTAGFAGSIYEILGLQNWDAGDLILSGPPGGREAAAVIAASTSPERKLRTPSRLSSDRNTLPARSGLVDPSSAPQSSGSSPKLV